MKSLLPLASLLALSLGATAQAQSLDARELARAAAVEAAKSSGQQQTIVMQEPTRAYFDLGAVLNPDFKVMSVRDDSVAARMGMKVNDQVTGVDQLELADQSLQSFVAYLDEKQHGDEVSLHLLRAGQPLTLTGTVVATVVPGWRLEVDTKTEETLANSNVCGRVSVFVEPPESRDLYPAYIRTIDDKNVISQLAIFKLKPGVHVIDVHELIERRTLRPSKMLQQAKTLEITVEPNKTYYIAAKYNRDERFSARDGKYWDPVVWKVVEQSCEGS